MSKTLLDNGTILTLGLVGVVAAIGAISGRSGSRATGERQTLMQNYRAVGQRAVKAGVVSQQTFDKAMASVHQYSDREIEQSTETILRILAQRSSTTWEQELPQQQLPQQSNFAWVQELPPQSSTYEQRVSRAASLYGKLNKMLKGEPFDNHGDYLALHDDYNDPMQELVISIHGDQAIIHNNLEDEDGDQADSIKIGQFAFDDARGIVSALQRYRPSLFKPRRVSSPRKER